MMIQNDVLDGAKLEGLIEGRMEGRMEGRVEGHMEGRMDMARNLKKLGVSTAIIMESSGLSEKEIEKL